jgi:hypothetical protein
MTAELDASGNRIMMNTTLLEGKMAKLNISKKIVEKEQAILKSLSFETRPFRHRSISKAHEETFRWVFQKPSGNATKETKLITWLEKGTGFFWVSEKPGSGKSTLMKFIVNKAATAQALKTWFSLKLAIIASHFFWSTGTEMQKSQQGLLQSLLYEIFPQCPDLIEPACRARWSWTIK